MDVHSRVGASLGNVSDEGLGEQKNIGPQALKSTQQNVS